MLPPPPKKERWTFGLLVMFLFGGTSFIMWALVSSALRETFEPSPSQDSWLWPFVCILSFYLIAQSTWLFWYAYRDERIEITTQGVSQPRLFQRRVIPWHAVSAVEFRPGELILESRTERIAINIYLYPDREALFEYVYAHLPPDIQALMDAYEG